MRRVLVYKETRTAFAPLEEAFIASLRALPAPPVANERVAKVVDAAPAAVPVRATPTLTERLTEKIEKGLRV